VSTTPDETSTETDLDPAPGHDLGGDETAEVDTTEDASPGDEGADSAAEPRGDDLASLLEREGDVAADYLEGLLDIADLDGDIDMDVEGERALVSIVGGDLTSLVGRDGVVLDALQELTRLAVLRETGARSRLMLDVDGHRARRRSELTERGRAAAEEVQRTGEPVKLTPMSAFERKVVHDAVAAAGLTSESEGEEPNRFVVVLPA
jgi:spoIIIJ-associated protein